MYIRDLMQTGAWTVDGDGDGLADGLDVSILISDGLSSQVYAAVAQLAVRLGLEVAALSLPLCYARSEAASPSPTTWRIIVGGRVRQECGLNMLPPLPANYARAVLHQHDLLFEGPDDELAKLLGYFAAQFPAGVPVTGADAVMLERDELIWYTQTQELSRGPLPKMSSVSEQSNGCVSCLSNLYSLKGLFSDSDGDFLADNWNSGMLPVAESLQEWVAVTNLAARWGLETLGCTFTAPCSSTGTQALIRSTEDASQPGIWLKHGCVEVHGDAYARTSAWRYLAREYPQTQIGMTWAEIALFLEGLARETSVDASWQEVDLEWEVEEVRLTWKQTLAQAEGSISAEIRVSESLPVRQQLSTELQEMASAAGVNAHVIVRCAYKQGLHWVKEELVPELLACGQVDRIKIEVAPFQVADALDPEARWLLELYPVDHVLACCLNMHPDQITFELNSSLTNTYRVTAWSKQGVALLTRVLDVWYGSQPYLPLVGEKPLVHPPTGGIKLVAGTQASFVRIRTDAERIFDVYQTEILPILLGSAETAGGLNTFSQPFFERLEIEVECSEPEELLGVREEMVSVADALHEDIYFVGLDLFKRLGEQSGQVLRSPGLILPDIRVRPGQRPQLRYRLAQKRHDQLIARPRLTAILLQGDSVESSKWEWQLASESEASRIGSILRAVDCSCGLSASITLTYPGGSSLVETRLHRAMPSPIPQGAANDVIYIEECRERLAVLKDKPGVQVRLAGVSRQGRHIYSIAATSIPGGAIVSTTKYAGWKPTWLLNNRHHANEVSSTNAAMELMQSLAEGSTQAELLQRINVACIPLENVDGAAIHQQLAQSNPLHKLHAARFNSQGREFSDAYFLDDPAVPEARALPSLWSQWVPDVVVDNHGIPSHEWEQPFSGYLCPWFASFWIPRSLFYAYFWLLDDQEAVGRKAAADLEKIVTTRLVAEQAIDERNQALLASWRKYFVPYLEDHFAGEERGGIMWYYVPYKSPQMRFASHRWPNLTILDFTTEVADETARGDYLKLCSRAHSMAQEACLHWLASRPVQLEQVAKPVADGFYRRRARIRPLI